MHVRWSEIDDPKKRQWHYERDTQGFDHTFNLTWDEVLGHLAPKPGEATSRGGLMRSFANSLARTLESEIHARAKKHVERIDGTIDGDLFDSIIQTLLAQKLLKNTPPPRNVRTKALYWQLAPKGIQRLAEMRALRSEKNGR